MPIIKHSEIVWVEVLVEEHNPVTGRTDHYYAWVTQDSYDRAMATAMPHWSVDPSYWWADTEKKRRKRNG